MAATATSTSSLLWRLFGTICFVLLLSLAYNAYQHYLNGDLAAKYSTVNNYKTVLQDSLRRVVAAPVVVRTPPTVVYRSLPPSAAQLAALRAGIGYDVSAQLRRELARAAPRAVAVTKQRLPVVALRDTTLLRRSGVTGQVVKTEAKTGTFRDPWLSLTGIVLPGRAGGPDSLQAKYSMRLDFDARAYSQRTGHWWQVWRGREVHVRLKSRNPNTVVTGLDAVKVEKR